jgi:hypothetical protein
MHQPIYWPDESTWTPGRYELAYETITLGHSESDVYAIFDKDDRVGDYQWYPRDAVASMLDLPEAGAQVSFAGTLIENLTSLGEAGWNGGRYAPDWYRFYREANGWNNSAGQPRLEPLIVGFHHGIYPLVPEAALRMELACAKTIYDDAWGNTDVSLGFFPAEMAFSERMIPALVEAGIAWVVVPDLHIARACADYPFEATEDLCDPPNPADQTNPAQGTYTHHFISRGVTLKIPYPYGFQPHWAEYVDPATGEVSRIVVVPAANAMSWDEGSGMYGTGDIDAIAPANDPQRPMLILLAHDGDNAWSGGWSYYYENIPSFSHQAAQAGYTPTTIATYLAEHPVPEDDVVHVEDGAWVNAEGDFGSPQFINWNWPLVDRWGQFDIPGGWALDERNWAVLMAAQNRVETAEQILGPADPEKVVDPLSGANPVETGWHFLLVGYESGYMYYGASLDMEIKATLACNAAVRAVEPVLQAGPDETPPTVWLPQRLPWNPGGFGAGSLWGYPGGDGAPMDSVFYVWTFADDVSGILRVDLMIRTDADGWNDPATHDNETYAGGPDVGPWQALPMHRRDFPADEPWDLPDVDFPALPDAIADLYWIELAGFSDVLLDYYVEAEDSLGNVRRTPIQHVYVARPQPPETGRVWWVPTEPQAGDSVTIFYDPVGGPLEGASGLWIHYGFDGWQAIQDSAMAWNPGAEAWERTLALPAWATVLDMAFHDETDRWDNNGGADWHVPISGGGLPFAMDGVLDPGAEPLASGPELTLWGAREGGFLYLATEGTSATPGADRFLFLCDGLGNPVPAPWAKSGWVEPWVLLLAAEEANGWCGWFDADQGILEGPGLWKAHGEVLEGIVDLETFFGTPWPDTLWVAAAGYETPDGGVLLTQVPPGDGDGDLGPDEYVAWPLATSGTEPPPEATLAPSLRVYPVPGRGPVHLSLRGLPPGRARVEVLDPRGRRIRRAILRVGPEGRATWTWDGRTATGRPAAAGLYWLRIVHSGGRLTGRVVRLP